MSGDLSSVGARGDHGGIAPTSAQIHLEIVAIIFEIGIKVRYVGFVNFGKNPNFVTD
jgi:hypothetical protein